MLHVDRLHAWYGKSHVLHGVSFAMRPGEIVSLLGRNGSGRSTTVKAIMGLVRAAGSVAWHERELLGRKAFEIARLGLGYVPESRDVFPKLTVQQNLLLGLKSGRAAGAAAATATATGATATATATATTVGASTSTSAGAGAGAGRPRWQLDDMYAMFPRLKEREHTEAGVLSGGEQQMLTLCRTLMGDPELIMIDEPTEGLAPKIVELVADYLRELRSRGLGVLLVEQKLTIALDVSERCLVMGHGRIVFEGTPEALRANAAVRREWLEV